MKAAILGAGISGLSAARLLKEKGVDVTVYEKETTVGGLARTRQMAIYMIRMADIFLTQNTQLLKSGYSTFLVRTNGNLQKEMQKSF